MSDGVLITLYAADRLTLEEDVYFVYPMKYLLVTPQL